jgi:AraC family transcriptional regulator
MDLTIEGISAIITPIIHLNLLGCVFYGDPFHHAKEWSYENEIGLLWGRYYRLCKKYQFLMNKINLNPNVGYELHIEPDEYKKTKHYYVFIGCAVESVSEIPLEFYYKPLPPTAYIQFTTKAHELDKAEIVFRKWLGAKKSGYNQAFPFVIQRYDATRYKSLEDSTSEIDWLIPIQQHAEDS